MRTVYLTYNPENKQVWGSGDTREEAVEKMAFRGSADRIVTLIFENYSPTAILPYIAFGEVCAPRKEYEVLSEIEEKVTGWTVERYLEYAQEQLDQIPEGIGQLAAYDNGHGLAICEYAGDMVSSMYTAFDREVFIKAPAWGDEQWEEKWKAVKKLANKHLKKYNKRKANQVVTQVV